MTTETKIFMIKTDPGCIFFFEQYGKFMCVVTIILLIGCCFDGELDFFIQALFPAMVLTYLLFKISVRNIATRLILSVDTNEIKFFMAGRGRYVAYDINAIDIMEERHSSIFFKIGKKKVYFSNQLSDIGVINYLFALHGKSLKKM